MRLIHNPQSVTCPICSKSFKTKLYLKRHLVSFHDVNPSDRQLQEEIYQHQLKVQIQGQTVTQSSPTSLSSSSSSINQQQNGIVESSSCSQQQQQQQINDQQNQSLPLPSASQAPDEAASDASSGEEKLRAYHAHIGDSAYPVEVVQISESKNFSGSILQFNASY